ncbi:TOBE domain-containing protein [Thauera sinica]|uniref:Molybdopterin-binding protein n=1 Tax=Thauera sinica TaxID=2665146 RepID=A0ABW1ASE0_9RHOO|nr:TOBE domain-containing protein [Thauera sp. K11]ATE61454.1 transporter [Thauera sp. K11]
MKISARNKFEGTVAAVTAGAVNAEVGIDLASGDKLVAIITLESARSLQLAPGGKVVALVKAPWVMLMTDGSGIRLSARNCLAGTVKTVTPGAVNAEVVVALPGGTEIVAIVTNDAVTELGLAPGVPATAVIKASNVILGVPA